MSTPAKICLLLSGIFILSACSRPASVAPQGAQLSSPARTPTPTPQPTAVPFPTPEVDECLFGTWQVDPETLAAYLMSFIASETASEFEILEVKGLLQLTFSEEFTTALTSDAYSLSLDVETEDSTFTSTRLQLAIKASGSSSYAVHQGKLITFAQNYALEPNIQIPVNISATSVTISTISLTPNHFIAMEWTPAFDPEFSFEAETPRYANYQCDAGAISLSQDNTPLIIFFRVDESVE